MERKLQKLAPKHQHKMLAEAVREDTARYLELCEAMNIEPQETSTTETLSNTYHHHLHRSDQRVREHNLLVRTGDRKEAAPFLPIDIYLDHIRSAHNVGSIFRTTEALRLGDVYLSAQVPAPEQKQVADASMGATAWVSWQQNRPLVTLRRPIIAVETVEGATPLADFAFPETFTLVVGNEEYGCSEEALALADHVIEIPLFGRKNSLNVANAFAIVAAEIRRQHDLRH